MVVSLAVGTPLAALEAALPAGTQVVRAMPNTPVRVRRGVTGLARGTAVTDAGFAAVQELFGLLGEVVVLDDERIDRISTISGSGPAYVYLLLERFADAAVGLGFDREDAERTVAATFSGALALLSESGESPADLRRGVTSPNGTTAAAVAVFEERDLGGLIADALAGALRRADELAGRADGSGRALRRVEQQVDPLRAGTASRSARRVVARGDAPPHERPVRRGAAAARPPRGAPPSVSSRRGAS